MIRAGRSVYTLADLAALEGRALGTYRNRRMHHREGHPAPVNSQARVLLYDTVQVDAWRAGRPVPPLPDADDPADLLDAPEAAALAGVTSRTWESYRHDSALAAHVVHVRGQQPAAADSLGVEHWPRAAVLAWQAGRPGRGHGGGRPPGSRDALPRDEITPRTAALLAAQPAITAAEVSDRLGIHRGSAHRTLSALREQAVAALLEEQPAASAEDVTARLGYAIRTAQTALTAARARRGGHSPAGTLF